MLLINVIEEIMNKEKQLCLCLLVIISLIFNPDTSTLWVILIGEIFREYLKK